MSVLKPFWRLPIFRNPTFLLVVWLGVVAVCGILKYTRGVDSYNNFLIFTHSLNHALSGVSLYAEYPAEYYDLFLYGIPFTALVAPFAVMPVWLGIVLWCVANGAVLYLALRLLGLQRWQFAAVIWISVNELYTAGLMQQFNIAVAGLIILSFALIERKRDFWAALIIPISHCLAWYAE